jgi:hypothetical protein
MTLFVLDTSDYISSSRRDPDIQALVRGFCQLIEGSHVLLLRFLRGGGEHGGAEQSYTAIHDLRFRMPWGPVQAPQMVIEYQFQRSTASLSVLLQFPFSYSIHSVAPPKHLL